MANRIIVRPKAPTLPRVQVWRVLREDPSSGEVEEFSIRCAEGMFFAYYRAQGLVEGMTQYDPYLDMEEGRMTRTLLGTYR